jgi:Glycosyltransferase 61
VQGDELGRDPDLAVDPLVVARDGDHVFVTQARHRDRLERLPEAVWLTGVHASGFGHLLVEFLPKLWALMERPGFDTVPILIDEGMPAQHEEAVRLFVDRSQPIVTLRRHQHVRVDRLWVASQIVYLATGPRPGAARPPKGRALHREGLRRLLGRAHAALGAIDAAAVPPRIYLTRKPTQARRLVNAPEIGALLARHGFHALDFGELPFIEQLRHIRGAEHVVGQDGSSIQMTYFGRSDLRIGGLAGPQLGDWEWRADACEALGQELIIVQGSQVMARTPTTRGSPTTRSTSPRSRRTCRERHDTRAADRSAAHLLPWCGSRSERPGRPPQ